MADTRVLSNQRVGWFAGPDTAISDWKKPTLTELRSLLNISEAVKIDGTDFNLEASAMSDDRSFTDGAGAQSRSYTQFGGNIEAFTPRPEDNTSITRQAKNTLGTPRTKLALGMRMVEPNHRQINPGDEINLFHTITDARAQHRSEVSYSYGVGLAPRDDVLVNYIVPSASPTEVVPSAETVTGAVGTVKFITVQYEGRNITIGATYLSSDPTKVQVTPHGALILNAAGTATITIDYPGSAGPVEVEVTVAAP